MNRRSFINYFIAVLVTGVLVGFTTYFVNSKGTLQTTTTITETVKETTTRTETVKETATIIRTVAVSESTVVLTEGQRDGPLYVEKIYFNQISGLRFVEYPVAVEKGVPITLSIGESTDNGCNIALTLVKIQDKAATFIKRVELDKICPICLSEATLIDTPKGPINIKELKKGMTVWTADTSGSKHAATILDTVSIQVPDGHRMVHLVFTDGREIVGSPRHPLTDGRTLADISPGDIVVNRQVIKAELVPYQGKETYDILPSGDTGTYWANGILLKSTLY